jgi:hypothetical protein
VLVPDSHSPGVAAKGELLPQCDSGSEALGKRRGNHRHRQHGKGQESEGQERCEHIREPCFASPYSVPVTGDFWE